MAESSFTFRHAIEECEAFCNAYRTVRWDYFFYFVPKRWKIIFALLLSEKINWPLVHQGVQVNLETLCIRLAWNYFPWLKKKKKTEVLLHYKYLAQTIF